MRRRHQKRASPTVTSSVTVNDDVDCILLRAAPGSHFGAPSSGEMADVASLTRQLDQISKPCIAAVSGYCADLGLALTLVCDIVIAARSARFQISRGPDSEYVAGALAGRIGRPRANALLMLGTFVDGSEAVAIGLAQRCVHDRDLDGEVKNQLASIRKTIAECREIFGQS